ncbi:hypothetical protein MTR_8g099390 [Medicago truncatula]|uniref:Uncharacterized protein n=1 Tax=Medicago truncatula TaxID=3880 RepID=A0A072TUU9_MEDTR|nr:hypothetical protein MTR_8g099390 [Medicago truncatula]
MELLTTCLKGPTDLSIRTKRTPHNKICEIKQRRTRRPTTQRRTKTMKSRKNTKEKLDGCENHLFRLKEREKMQMGDSRSKIDLKSLILDE